MDQKPWTIHNDRLSDAITKNSIRKVKKMCAKGDGLLNCCHPLTGEHPLYVAVRWNRIKICKLLLTNGAKPNATRPKFNDTALHLAAMEGHDLIVQLLLENDADRTLENFNGNVPIDLAIEQKQSKAVAALVVPPHTIRHLQCHDSSLNSISVQWEVPQSKGSTVTRYTLRIYTDPLSPLTVHDGPVRTLSNIEATRRPQQHDERRKNLRQKEHPQQRQHYVIDHCVPGITYHVSVQACNDAGWSLESNRVPMRGLPTPPATPSMPYVKSKSTTYFDVNWQEPLTNGYPINCYEIGYRVIRLKIKDEGAQAEAAEAAEAAEENATATAIATAIATKTTRRRLTPDEAKDQSLFASIATANEQLQEAKRQEKIWLAIYAPLDFELSENWKAIGKAEKDLQTMNTKLNKGIGGKSNTKNDDDDDDDVDEASTAQALRQAKQVLAEKIQSIEVARETIYKNGVLVNSWRHEQELRFAMDQVNEFKENLKVWAKEQAKELKIKKASRFKNLQWEIEGASRRLTNRKQEYYQRKQELMEKRHDAQEKHNQIIQTCSKKVQAFKSNYWKSSIIGGTKMKNDILIMKMKNNLSTSSTSTSTSSSSSSSSNSCSIPTGSRLTPLSPSTQYVLRLRARNAVGWSAWSKETATNYTQAKTLDGIFNIGHRYSSTRLWLSWNPSLVVVHTPQRIPTQDEGKERNVENVETMETEMKNKKETSFNVVVPAVQKQEEGKKVKEEKEEQEEKAVGEAGEEEIQKENTTMLLPAKNDVRIEFQDLLSFAKRSHEWIECIKYDDEIHKHNSSERIKYKKIAKLKAKQKQAQKREQEKLNNRKNKKKKNRNETNTTIHATSSNDAKNTLQEGKLIQTPFENEDESMWDLPLVEIDHLLPGMSPNLKQVKYKRVETLTD